MVKKKKIYSRSQLWKNIFVNTPTRALIIIILIKIKKFIIFAKFILCVLLINITSCKKKKKTVIINLN